MTVQETGINVGDRVIISCPRSSSRFAANIERLSTVTAIRPRSFDAGGLCFRVDGREWYGRSHARLISHEEEEDFLRALARADEERRHEIEDKEREEVVLASLLTYRHEKEWLQLGLDELRRIAALLGIHHGSAQGAEVKAALAEE
jgi:hypothetical protein